MAVKIPIIPTNIIVHLAAPQESAKNIKVPFIEYIKNVASNEIYPTWPTNALRANILSQISFALNRVYNEWYKSKGYNFDITNQPSFDQKYKENSEIYESISIIVDEIFNDYLVRNEQVQPLFASYCDGKTTICDGLSQWGSVSLAEEGKTTEQIIKKYYGDDIKIIRDAPTSANIISYPGIPLRLGSAGNDVKIIKTQLNRISKNYPAIPKLLDESVYFTIETDASVRKFQEIFNLKVNGVVDSSTWYKIKYIYNAVKEISEIYSEGISLKESDLIYEDTLKEGSTGEGVRTLDYLLSTIAYFDDFIPDLDVSMEFGPELKEMVMAFQDKYNVEPTGIVDRSTWNLILSVYNTTINAIPMKYVKYENEFFPGEFLSLGMTGEDILKLQSFLLIICEKFKNIPGVKLSGVFDNLTKQSVQTIQKRNDLEVSGVVGPTTWYKIVEESKK